MTRTQYQVIISVTVTDPAALAAAAAARAIEDGIEAEDWAETRSRHDDPIGSDLRMLLDPGVSPPGTQIDDSAAEYV